MNKVILLTMVCALFPINSFANKIYHCEDAKGNKSFQSLPCKGVTVEVQEISETSRVINTKTEKDNTSTLCVDEIEKDLGLILKDINDHYERRTGQCKKHYASGTSHRKNCLQEQDEVKQAKMKKYYEPKKKTLNNC
ncbi:hypothetical protein [Motilimonas eburnea]|uniref:hypothetical protein n=1 Tax=Motilimonas eburnea TaxID=1737488 RepID=UPI001E47969D|nr:hypothetical protein [Motilimonas eburnea]MCE2573237.1 hypothetical protein [Motilimonas eburnea]